MVLDVLEELDSSLQLPAVDSLGGLAGVLERNSEVGTAGAGRFRGLNLLGGVSDLFFVEGGKKSVHLVSLFHLSHDVSSMIISKLTKQVHNLFDSDPILTIQNSSSSNSLQNINLGG